MLYNEAQWIADRLNEFDVERISPLVNLGSSSSFFREKAQQFISNLIFRPLERRGVKVVHLDLEEDEGVDIKGDIFGPAVYAEVCSHNPRAVLCSNILEHVAVPAHFARLCIDMVPKGGLIIATIPYSFPFHPSPVDTMYRPGCEELSKIFPGCKTLQCEIVTCETFGKQMRTSLTTSARHLLHLVLPWPTLRHWRSALHKNLWLFKNYQTTCAVFEKGADEPNVADE